MGGHSRFIFQSTLPVWGATRADALLAQHLAISIHAPRVGSDFGALEHEQRREISIHAPRVGSDSPFSPSRSAAVYFNPRSPCGERRGEALGAGAGHLISIHAPRVGSDIARRATTPKAANFNPRSPCGERRDLRIGQFTIYVISIHAPRVGSDLVRLEAPVGTRVISIQAPRVGSDWSGRRSCSSRKDFNPRSPCGERLDGEEMFLIDQLFQSTLPVWGATWSVTQLFTLVRFQSTLPVWGATLGVEVDLLRADISIHAPRVGSDLVEALVLAVVAISIHAPRVGSDRITIRSHGTHGISIHAPRVGSDDVVEFERIAPQHFNPRSPCGERRIWSAGKHPKRAFQSTLPVWGATHVSLGSSSSSVISIHAPRVGSDSRRFPMPSLAHDFNPRSPCGERLASTPARYIFGDISIHAPRVGSDAASL